MGTTFIKSKFLSFISYAVAHDGDKEYVRARRYMPHQAGLSNTDLSPDYFNSGLFTPGQKHRLTIIKRGNDISMLVANDEKTSYFHWNNDQLPPVTEGRIGLRLMYTRISSIKDFRVSLLK